MTKSEVYYDAGAPTTNASPVVDRPARKIVYDAYLDLVVREPDTAVARIVALAEEFGGFVNQTSNRRAVIRVPAARRAEAIERIAALGKLRDKRLTGEDVTDAYLDYGIRLDNAEKTRARYLELLAKAQNVEETLLVEKELSRLTETIDLLKGRMQELNKREAYTLLTVSLNQKAKLGPLGYVFKGLYGAVKWMFVRG